jgi:hypothetical protein
MKITSILASGAVALGLVGVGVAGAGAASAHVQPVPTATGNVALANPSQYMSFNVFAGSSRYHGSVDYANFTQRAFGTNVWNIRGTHQLVFAGSYAHTMKVTTVTPLSTHETKFLGTGTYNADSRYLWTISGTVHWNKVSFDIVYTAGPDKGYKVSGTGLIKPDGSVSGIALDSNKVTLPFTMPTHSAFQVLRYTAPVTWAFIWGHDAYFGYNIPKWVPVWSRGMPVFAKVHDGGLGFAHDTCAYGVATWWHFWKLTQYPITSGNITVHR